jgi:hypothetical protein
MPSCVSRTVARGTHKRTGRPPNAIKASCRKDFDEVRPLLRELAKTGRMKLKKARGSASSEAGDEEEVVASFSDRIRAIDLLGKYGMDQNVSIADVRACLKETQQEIRELLPKEQYEMLWARIMPHWMKL